MATYLYPPVSVTTLPPVGGATSANQVLEIAQLTDINTELDSQTTILSTLATETTLSAINTKTPALLGGRVPVDNGLVQGLTDTQLRATPVPVSMAAVPTGAATEAKQDIQITALNDINTELDTQTTRLNLLATEATLSAMSAKLPATLGSKADAASLAVTQSTEDKARIGSLTETAPATDTASSGLNGRLQRIAQRLTSLIALLPAALGQGTMAQSLRVVLASDQTAIPVSLTPTGTSTFVTQSVVDSGVSTFTVPANAKRMVVYNNADAAGANRIRRGNAGAPPAWPSTGPILGVGSFTSELPATTFTCIAEDNSAPANVSVEYFY